MDTLTNTTPIGVTMESPGTFTSEVSSTYNDASKFTSDSADYVVGKTANNRLLLGAAVTVTYAGNGGTGTMTDSNSLYASGSTVTVKENEFTPPDNNMFSGWNTAADGTGTSYSAGDTFTISVNTTLTAQWKPAVASVTIGGETTYYTAFDGGAGSALYAWINSDQDATLKLLADVKTSSQSIRPSSNSGRNVTIDLNGYGIRYTGTGNVGSGNPPAFIQVGINNTDKAYNLTLQDSAPNDRVHKLTLDSSGRTTSVETVDAAGTDTDTVKYVTGGYITGATSSIYPATDSPVVALKDGSTFTMTGGTIIGNACPAVSLQYGGTFTMTGGVITGNGKGVTNSAYKGTVQISGTPKIYDNYTKSSDGSRTIYNVQVVQSKPFIVTGSLSHDARIGLYANDFAFAITSGLATSGNITDVADARKIFPIDPNAPNYYISLENNEAYI